MVYEWATFIIVNMFKKCVTRNISCAQVGRINIIKSP